MSEREGVFFDLPESEYHQDKSLGSTDLRKLLCSGPDYWFNSPLNPNRPQRTSDALIIGKALHRLVLEGNQAFTSRFVRRPDDVDRLTAKLKAELCPNGEEVLAGDDYDRVLMSAELIKQNPDLATAFEGGMPEVSVFWTEKCGGFPIRCKARFDYLKVRGIGDLKSIRNYMGKPFADACARSIVEYRYDVQALHYLIGRTKLPELVARGLVYGDHDQEWLKRVTACHVFAFQWVFFQADSAPITWSRSISPDNPILDIAERDRTRALTIYREFMQSIGPDKMWVLQDPVRELEIGDMPAWFK